MIILFSNCGFAIIAFLFYLCGSNRVAKYLLISLLTIAI